MLITRSFFGLAKRSVPTICAVTSEAGYILIVNASGVVLAAGVGSASTIKLNFDIFRFIREN
jgi:hypothetical protein